MRRRAKGGGASVRTKAPKHREPAGRRARGRRDLSHDDRGVTVVVGAVLLAALLVSTLVTVRLYFVPVWEEEAEAAHMRTVDRELLNINADLARLVANTTNVGVANPVSLGDARASVFRDGGPALGGRLWLNATERAVTLSSNQLLIVERNGTSLAGLNETWTTVSGSSNIVDVAEVLSFRLRIDAASDPGVGNSDKVYVNITDANGNAAGSIRVLTERDPPDFNVIVETRDAGGTVLQRHGLAYQISNTVSPVWVDLMSQQYRFDRVLRAAQGPFEVAVDEDGLDADYAITYVQDTGLGGPVVVGGNSGQVFAPWNATYAGGSLRFKSSNLYFVDQEYILENGGVILKQAEGAVFKVRPLLFAGVAGTQTALTVQIPSITGNETGVSADANAVVYASPQGHTSFVGLAPSFTVSVNTSHPALWVAAWRERLEQAGLREGGGHFATSTTIDSATVTVYGLTTDPASTVNDLTINFRRAVVGIEI